MSLSPHFFSSSFPEHMSVFSVLEGIKNEKGIKTETQRKAVAAHCDRKVERFPERGLSILDAAFGFREEERMIHYHCVAQGLVDEHAERGLLSSG